MRGVEAWVVDAFPAQLDSTTPNVLRHEPASLSRVETQDNPRLMTTNSSRLGNDSLQLVDLPLCAAKGTKLEEREKCQQMW